ncbi:MAG: alpha-amylase [Bacteroidaceae bacterium]|nr:alpha-amylase [Bacteroidaceae bacterium]
MRPVIYQIFTRLYGAKGRSPRPWGGSSVNGCGTLADIDTKALAHIRDMGFTHLWCTGLIRHATCSHFDEVPDCNPRVVKGLAGSPYAITDYYDIDPDLAVHSERRRDEYLALVRRVHRAGLRLVIDFVPNHVSREYHSICCPAGVTDLGADDDKSLSFAPSNNFYYINNECLHTDHLPVHDYAALAPEWQEFPARATGNDVFHAWPGANDWYETVKLNYGIDYATGTRHFDPIPDTWLKMTDILLFWASTGVDAFRCDMAEMVPVEFWHYAIARVKEQYPGVEFIAEVYNPELYRSYIHFGGFDYLYDKVGLYDCLRDVMCSHRWAGEITHAWQATDDIRSHMLAFLENHDEQRIASPQFAADARRGMAGMIAAVAVCRGPVMIYAGQELGEPALDAEGFSGLDGRTTIFDYWTVDSLRRTRLGCLNAEESVLRSFYARLLSACNQSEALRDGELYDLMYVNPPSPTFDAQHVYVCLRHSARELLLIAANFSDHPQSASVIIPQEAFNHIGISPTSSSQSFADLLSEYQLSTPLSPNIPINLSLPAFSGVIMRHER